MERIGSGNDPWGIAADATGAYWVDNGYVYGYVGASEPVWQQEIFAEGLAGPAADAVNVYFLADQGPGTGNPVPHLWDVMACPIGGCGGGPITIASAQPAAASIVSDGANVFWATGYAPNGALMACAVGGCAGAPTQIASGAVNGIAVDTTNVYWTTGAAVMTCPKTGCGATPTTLVSGLTYAFSIAVDATSVYWTTDTAVMKCAIGGCAVPTTLADGQNGPHSIAVDGQNAYWATGASYEAGTVFKCSVNGCCNQPQTLASNVPTVTGIAVGPSSVYWSALGECSECGVVTMLTPK